MGVARSSYYADPKGKPRDDEIIAEIRAITDDFEGYGYRRVGAGLRPPNVRAASRLAEGAWLRRFDGPARQPARHRRPRGWHR